MKVPRQYPLVLLIQLARRKQSDKKWGKEEKMKSILLHSIGNFGFNIIFGKAAFGGNLPK
jgi:hypothetical protein